MNGDALSRKGRDWAARFDGLSLRERALALAMALVLVGSTADALLLEPVSRREATARQDLNAAETQAAALQAQLAALGAQRPADPNATLRDRGAQLRARIAEADAQLHDFGQGLVSPADMPRLLEKLLAETGGPRLEGFRKLPVADVLSPVLSRVEGLNAPPKLTALKLAGAEAAPPVPEGQPPLDKAQDTLRQDAGQVYRHGVELTLTGSYADLLGYLDAVENMPWKVLWGEVRLETVQHPRLRMRLTLYTLSLERDWLVL
jgi:MSHA biogenesis protein MshJ